MAEFASKSVAGTGLGLGISGTVLGLLNGGLGNILGGYNNYNGNCSDNCLVNRYDLEKDQKIAKLETEVALRDANIFTDQKLNDFRNYVDRQFRDIRETDCEKWSAQGVINANMTSGINILNSQVSAVNNTLGELTKTVIPNSSICPGFGDVKVCVIPCDPQPKSTK